MTLQITMRVFSGRPDPQWTIDGAQEEQLRRLLDSPGFDSARPILPWKMGYRGFSVVDLAAPDRPLLRVRSHSMAAFDFFGAPEVEQFLVNTAPADDPDVPVQRNLRFPKPPRDIDRPPRIEPRVIVAQSNAVDAVPWTPDDPKWSGPNLSVTNCYAYAINRSEGRFLMPGDRSNNVPHVFSGAGSLSGVLSDGLFRTTGPSVSLGAGDGFHCCLVVWPGQDHHWYRQDTDGWWSHKMGGTSITRLDLNQQPIADPRHCARGPYTIFVAWLRNPKDRWT